MSLEALYGAIYLIAVAISLVSMAQLHRFLGENPAIRDSGNLERYKSLARVQMYLALGMVALLGGGMIAGLIVLLRHGLTGFLAVVLTNLFVLGLGQVHKKVEERTRNLQTVPGNLDEEYRHVSESWVKKVLPDF